MSRIECKYESEILDAVASGRWPERLSTELHDHVSLCSICSELAMVSAMYRDDYASTMDEVRVPSAGLVWWKSELRARREAVRVASRPITLVTGIAGVGAIVVLAVVILTIAKGLDIAAISAFVVAQPLLLWLALAVVLALTPIALYFVYSGE